MAKKKTDDLERLKGFLANAKRVSGGIDPGTSGAIAFIHGASAFFVMDMPTIEVARVRRVKIPDKDRTPGGPKTKTAHGMTKRFDLEKILKVFDLLRYLKESLCVAVEVASPMVGPLRGKGPKGGQNIRTAYMVGCGYYMWPLFLLGRGHTVFEVEPEAWKTDLQLIKKDKDASRALAKDYWPEAPVVCKKHHGRAEALLLAHWSSSYATELEGS